MKYLIITTETSAQMDAVVSFLKTAVGMQRNANSIIDFREPREVEDLYGFSVGEYNEAMETIGGAAKIPIELAEQYDESKTPSYNLISKIRWGTDDQESDLAFWLSKWFRL